MSKTLLQHLFDGEVYPAENIKATTQEHRELNEKIGDEKLFFKSLLSPENWLRFETLGNMEFQRTSCYSYECFAYGFRLGTALIVEALASDNELVPND